MSVPSVARGDGGPPVRLSGLGAHRAEKVRTRARFFNATDSSRTNGGPSLAIGEPSDLEPLNATDLGRRFRVYLLILIFTARG